MKTGEFEEEHNVTVGVEFIDYTLVLNGDDGVKLQVWDTAGQEQFRAITRSFYKDSDAVFIVFSMINKQSFDSLQNWVNDVDNNAKENVVKYLVGNFSDMEEER